MKKILIILFLLMLQASGYSQNQKLLPRDESPKDPSLNEFVIQFKDAIRYKDKDFILNSLDKDFIYTFGYGAGIEEFIEMWNLNSPNSEIWTVLDKIVNLGGVIVKENDYEIGISYPYVFDLELENSDDYFSIMVVTANKVAVKETPDNNAKTIAELSYDVIWTDYSESFKPKYEADGWIYMKTLDGEISGYIENEYVYSPTDYRLLISKSDGGDWKFKHFVAGD